MRRVAIYVVTALFVCFTLAGCLIDGTLDKDGGGTLTVKLRLMSIDQLPDAKKQMQSPQVELVSTTLDDDKWATFTLKFADVTKLSTTQFFDRTTFTLADDEGGTQTLNVKFVNTSRAPLTKEMADYFGNQVTFIIHLPGKVVKTNATQKDGNTATWSYLSSEVGEKAELTLSATYKRPAK
jgi:LppM domain